jgi:ATP-dependent Clp protease adaptor protein ClpS
MGRECTPKRGAGQCASRYDEIMPATQTVPETENVTEERLEKLYHVIMLNDDEHTFDYVIEMLQKIFRFSYAEAMAHTMEADSTGSSILITCELKKAEQKRDQIHAHGPDWRLPHSRGSVTALVEPAV